MSLDDQVMPIWRRGWELPADETVTGWAERSIAFSTIPTPRPGPYSTTLTPYVREPLECWRDPMVRECVLCWGSQTAKTTTLMVGLMWQIRNDPGPVLWVFPNRDLAKVFSENRWLRLVYDNPSMAELLPKDRRRVKHLMQPFSGAPVIFIGSNSPANLASNPARIVVMDEVDKLAEQSSKEANAVELAEQRAKSFWLTRKVWLTSTPTVPDAPIWERYLSGDQRRYILACPSCGGDIIPVLSKSMTGLAPTGKEAELVWDREAREDDGNWDWHKVKATVRLCCPHCQHHIADHEKTRMLRAGRWMPTADPVEAWRRSYHLSSLYSIDIPWSELVVQFLRAKQSLDGLQGFVNGALAEPWQHQEDRQERRELVVAADAPPLTTLTRIMAADYQATPPSWWVVREWAEGGHSRLVEWGTWDSFDQLDEHRQRLGVAPDLCGIDSGYEASEVYRECARLGMFALRGDEAQSWPHQTKQGRPVQRPWVERRFDPYIGTPEAGRRGRIVEIRWSNPTVKDILATLRKGDRAPVRWEVPEQYATDDYFRHLDGEYKRSQYNARTGKTKWVWQQRGRRWPNHLFDCEAMQIAVAVRIGLLNTKGETDE